MSARQLTIDYNAVQHAALYYDNGKGNTSRTKPKYPTVNGQRVKDEKALFSSETMLELATRRGLLDVWEPVVILQFKSNHSMTFSGDKAKQKWKQYNAHIYGK
jgi:hypothetical protein